MQEEPKAIEPKAIEAKTIFSVSQHIDFRCLIKKDFSSVYLFLINNKGHVVKPDFRRYSGEIREILREFQANLEKNTFSFSWNKKVEGEVEACLINPDTRLLEKVLKAGILVDEGFISLKFQEDEYPYVLMLEKKNSFFFTSPCLDMGLSSEENTDKSKTHTLYTISPSLVVSAQDVYKIKDQGSFWFEDSSLKGSHVKETDIEIFLSIALSRFTALTIKYNDYNINVTKPIVARPALLFTEIDEYDYLHIRPISSLEGFKPGFFEDQEITRIAQINDEEKEINISEVLFPHFADEVFRNAINSMGKEAKNSVFEENGFFILTPDFAKHFLSEKMPYLMSDFNLFQSDKLNAYKIKPVRPKLKLTFKSGIKFLEGSAEIEIENESFSYSKFLSQYRRQKYISLQDGTRAYPEYASVARFERLLKLKNEDEDNVEISFFDFPALHNNTDLEVIGDAWKKPEDFYLGYNDLHKKTENCTIHNAELRSYQDYGAKWINYLRLHNLSGCLADEMGLGKTIQTIAVLRAIYTQKETRPSIIIMPRSLLYNWQAEFEKFAPEIRTAIHYGTDRNLDSLKDAQVILTSYALARLDMEALVNLNFYYIILDEAQMIKNIETKTNHAILQLKSEHRLALSGTPIENSLSDVYSLFSFLNPGMFGTQKSFSSLYLKPIQEAQDKNALKDLKARLYPFILRRMKRDVLPELPLKTEQIALIELDKHHLSLYHKRRIELNELIKASIEKDGFAKSQFLILQAFTEMRRLASIPEAEGTNIAFSAKREYLKETLQEITQNGHKCLIFSNYLASVDLISNDCEEANIGNLIMTGATRDRQSLVKQFQADKDVKAFIMTLKTGGLGLNLTAADYVFIFDPWWNRAAEAQAIDRTHRMGQKNPVFCYRMIAKDTIEEKILLLQEQKAKLASALLSSDTEAFKTLDESDIRYLLEY